MFQRKRQTHNVLIDNLPNYVTEKDVSKKFTPLGEIQGIIVKKSQRNTKSACIKFLCEPDAVKAIQKYNGATWDKNIIIAKKFEYFKARDKNRDPTNSQAANSWFALDSEYQFYPLHSNQTSSYLGLSPSYPYQASGYYSPAFSSLPGTKSSGPLPLPLKGPLSSKGTSFPLNMPSVLSHSEQRVLSCTFVENAVTFYGHSTSRYGSVEKISLVLQRCCPSLPRVKTTPDYGKLYAAIYSGDALWYRCKIIKNRSVYKATVQYIDYGNTEEVEFHRLTELPESLKKLPFLAPKCVFNSVSLASQMNKQSTEGKHALEEKILGRNVIITTLSLEDSPVYEVTECMCDNEDIIKGLLDSGLVVRKMSQQNGSVSSDSSNSKRSKESSPKSTHHSTDSSSGKARTLSPKGKSPPVSGKCEAKVSILTSVGKTLPDLELQKVTSERESLKNQIDFLEKQNKTLKEELNNKIVEAAKNDIIRKLESVASYLQLVNSVRSSPQESQEPILHAFAMLRKVNSDHLEAKSDLAAKIEEALALYKSSLKAIMQCKVKDYLQDLIKEKNANRENICRLLTSYLNLNNSMTVDSTTVVLKEVAHKLRSKQKSYWDLSLTKNPSSLEELEQEYNTVAMKKLRLSEEIKQKTNRVHEEFLVAFSEFQKGFYLYDGSCISEESQHDKNIPYLGPGGIFSSEKFINSLDSLQSALESEINVMYSEQARMGLFYGAGPLSEGGSGELGNSVPTIMQCLMRELESVLKKLVDDTELRQKYETLLTELSNYPSLMCSISVLTELRKQIKGVKSKLRHMLADKKDLEETDICDENAITEVNTGITRLLRELHNLFAQEDGCLENLMKAYETCCPELDLDHPEFGISQYARFKGILKENWEADHFHCEKLSNCIGICYRSVFCDKDIIIKEFLLESKEKEKQLLERIISWNSVLGNYLVPVLAAFKKSERQMCVLLPWMKTVEQEKPMSLPQRCNIIEDTMKCLHTLSSNHLIHGIIHPSTVVLDSGSVKLDFCFEVKPYIPSCEINGINFQAPELLRGADVSEFTDVFTFGCFVLAVLFPELTFAKSAKGTPCVNPHRSAIEKKLSASDYTVISCLVYADPAKRPSVKKVLKWDLSKYITSAVSVDCSDSDVKVCDSENEDYIIPVPVPCATGVLMEADLSSDASDVISACSDNGSKEKDKDGTLNMLFSLRENIKNVELGAGDSETDTVSKATLNVEVPGECEDELKSMS